MSQKTNSFSKIGNSASSDLFTKAISKFRDIPIYVAVGIFILTTTIFFWEVLMGNAFFWEDIVRFVYPLQNFAAKEASKGIVPFWNPFTFSGMPFLADLQVGFF